jgi:hypothetical protein
MGTFWEKLKFWAKVILFGVAALYVLIVVMLNWGLVIEGELNLLFAKYQRPHVLTVLIVTAVLSIFGWWLFRTVFKALRQWQRLQDKSRTVKLEREVAEMKAKAGMLQTKNAGAATTTGAAFPVVPVASAAAPGTSTTSTSSGSATPSEI